MNGWLLARVLRDPDCVACFDAEDWNAVIAIARAEQMIGTLSFRLEGVAVPAQVARILDDARTSAVQGQIVALWEAEAARRVLALVGERLVLLKGTAFAAAGMRAGIGRSIGDLDILVPRDRIAVVEAALLAAGWEWVKPDPYDHAYYRQWMHELPPLIHRERDRMIDVHHTILPTTARIKPDPAALLADAVELAPGISGLCPNDMLVHAAAHLFADGDLAGGMRNLWDVQCLVGQFGTHGLAARASHHGLSREVARALRLAEALYGDAKRVTLIDRLYLFRITARDGWGRPGRPVTRMAFYVRSHWLRMPPGLLARHLWTKWRKGGTGPGSG
ncbi:nucleotidyltransferase family protein [Sphingomonas sp. TREG-RG-20F-R18-01]|uniref:nucleotidyltransferase domain-containing protein n=1 Tax=Sphingomonas sp. TREG-RG-20F-R18-01 TaxID=2914982 RepID=UPI001F588234|nr:nucleotidyltransferase family protein [Sphingomonas sp. TREG-RG-20F-R18-01]